MRPNCKGKLFSFPSKSGFYQKHKFHIIFFIKEWELMIVGRCFVVLLVAISILWIPIIQASQGFAQFLIMLLRKFFLNLLI